MTAKKSVSSRENLVRIARYFDGTIAAQQATQKLLAPAIAQAGDLLIKSYLAGGKWMIFGNGGSAADAQHLAAEMVGRLYKLERKGLGAIALTTDSSALTCIANDYSYDNIFARQLEALGRPGDAVLGISTSGNSPNVLAALKLARKMGLKTIALTGGTGGKMKGLADVGLVVPAAHTFHIQECHIAIGHLLCFLVEEGLAKRGFFKN